MLDKTIKEFNNDEFVYQLGYDSYKDKIYPCIEIYKNKKLISWGYWSCENNNGLFNFYINNFTSASTGTTNTIKEMFIELRNYNEIPKYIEKEYESLFVMYKLNNFNEY